MTAEEGNYILMHSEYVSIVECPFCGAKINEPCIEPKETVEVTHILRVRTGFAEQKRLENKPTKRGKHGNNTGRPKKVK